MNTKTEAQIARMKTQTIGVEIEMNGISREKAAKIAAATFAHVGQDGNAPPPAPPRRTAPTEAPHGNCANGDRLHNKSRNIAKNVLYI